MDDFVKTAGLVLVLLILFGCAQAPPKPTAPSEYAYSVHALNYSVGNSTLSALLCEPNGTNSKTPGLVLTGGDGVTAEKMRSICEAFAKKGFLVLAHDNPSGGTLAEEVGAVVEGAKILRSNSSSRPVALWAHSAGTIFSSFAAYEPTVKPFAFIDTSGHMQIPICDKPGTASPVGGQCLAYWSEFPASIMIVQGENDSVVDASFAQEFSTRLSNAGKFHRILMVPGGEHEFMLDKSGVLDAETEFLMQAAGESR
ncbi:Dienelactone hydrolase family protein [uncultured archaeon]|nr:Dienelactone hydrolase family protein [uncultured archaeon]